MQVDAQPYPFDFEQATTALVIIDVQRDFVEPGGFGETLGNDVGLLQSVVPPLRKVLDAARAVGLTVIHTREGHLPDLSDCPPAKLNRGDPTLRIGAPGPKGRILIRGEYGHDIIDDLAPSPGELVIDKPGKGSFHGTSFGAELAAAGSRRSWSPASPPRCACTPPSGRPTTAATSASCSRTASAPTSPSSSGSAWP
jgi:nicotinamidase-related amidase